MVDSVPAVRTIVAIRGERGSYNVINSSARDDAIVAIRGERGSYNLRAAEAGIM